LQKINALPTQTPNSALDVNPMQTNALELNDIHVPEQISNYPIAYGWWLLAALLILLVIFTIIKIRKKAKRNRIKKQALAQLKGNPEISISDTISLLKWAAMHYFSRKELAKLFGNSLQLFLVSKLPLKHQVNFTHLSEHAFQNQYKSNTNKDEDFYKAALLWLTHALPPKQLKVTEKNEHSNEMKEQGANT
jgi:hypothetical protein